ncbi:MAG: 3'-5' exonuclease [Xanthobacteraceae bacterium]
MRDLMVDIETLGTAPGSVIASIDAVEFDATTGEFGKEFYHVIDIADAQKQGLTIDASTVKWWMQQSEEARASTFSETNESLLYALYQFLYFVESTEAERIWAHSPAFDIVLLEAAYKAIRADWPWSHRNLRDTRTVYDLAGVTVAKLGTEHNALDDAKAQAGAVIEAYRVLGKSVEVAA